jgi:protein-S-isoprenylcysteine O-methyltransferase Ste14
VLIIGIIGFGLLFLNDLNDYKYRVKWLNVLFPLGLILLIVSTVFLSVRSEYMVSYPVLRDAAGGFALMFLLLEIFTLFFAVPARESYTGCGGGRKTVKTGMYALCRHPGAIWFILLYLCLCGSFGIPLYAVFIFSGLDLALIVFEDSVVFPEIFSDYTDYQKTVPFIVPTAESVSRCARFYFMRNRKDSQ